MRTGLTLLAVLALAGAARESTESTTMAHHRLDIRDLTFTPDSLRVAVGDTLTWTNHDIVPHTVTGQRAEWDSGALGEDGRFEVVLSRAGVYTYVCRYHPTMTATIVVR